jgi:HAD superfamily phosphoserine phosphatase-like hydrolase
MATFQAVALDIDGTLTAGGSVPVTSAALGLPAGELAELIQSMQNGVITESEFRTSVVRRWRAGGRAYRSWLHEFFESISLRADAFELAAHIQRMNLPACLITSSMDLFAGVIAARLAIDDTYANIKLHFDRNGILSDITFTQNAANLKSSHLLDFCAHRGNISPHKVMVIGDNDNDIDIFSLTGNGIFLDNPTASHLRLHARHTISSLRDAIPLLE